MVGRKLLSGGGMLGISFEIVDEMNDCWIIIAKVVFYEYSKTDFVGKISFGLEIKGWHFGIGIHQWDQVSSESLFALVTYTS